MSMEHKAFLFDYTLFQRELMPIIEASLATEQSDALIDFIKKHRTNLLDPYEGEPLPVDWIDMIEGGDVDQYADFCLTKYYDPKADLGLGEQWISVQESLESCVSGAGRLTLGVPLSVGDRYFDPGKMGSYFSTEEMIGEGVKLLQELDDKCRHTLLEFDVVKNIYNHAKSLNKGLYVTF